LEFEKVHIRRERFTGHFIVLRRFLFEPVNRLQRRRHRRGLQHAGASDEGAPEVRHFEPIGFGLRLDADAPTDDGAESDNGRDRHVIRWALQALGDIVDPRSQRSRHEFGAIRLYRHQAGGQRLRVRPAVISGRCY
jgi:hypothetical protein